VLKTIQDLPLTIDGVQAIGKISKEDYENTLMPLIERVRREGRQIRFLYQLGPEFEGFTPGAAWEDAKIGLQNMRLFDACAVVTDLGWIREATRLAAFLMPCPVRVFENQDLKEAISWLDSLPEGTSTSHRLFADSGVIVVEVNHPLRSQDFDALALTADNWIEAHGHLQGLVIHAHEFPGWENFGSFLRHLRFVRDHHRKVKRVALAADAKLASLMPKIAEHFIQAELKSFRYGELEGAIAWASGPLAQRAASPHSGSG
jgi:nitroreductase